MQISVDAADVEENTEREEMEMLTGPWGKCNLHAKVQKGREMVEDEHHVSPLDEKACFKHYQQESASDHNRSSAMQ